MYSINLIFLLFCISAARCSIAQPNTSLGYQHCHNTSSTASTTSNTIGNGYNTFANGTTVEKAEDCQEQRERMAQPPLAATAGGGGQLPQSGGGGGSTLRDFFTLLALSVHAVFEGLAVGLEGTSNGVWQLFAGM